MKERDFNIPPELSPDYDEYVDVALDLANGTLSPAREAEVRARLETDATFRAVVQPILDAQAAPRQMSRDQLSARWLQLQERNRAAARERGLELNQSGAAARVRARRISRRTWVGLAAATLIAAFGIDMATGMVIEWFPFRTIESYANTTLSVMLPDNSNVRLGPNARLKYRKDFLGEDRRTASIDHGEGTFTVAPHAKPFEVRTRHMRIVAVGTRFTVYPYDRATRVVVHEGRVRVFGSSRPPRDSTEVKAGQEMLLGDGFRRMPSDSGKPAAETTGRTP